MSDVALMQHNRQVEDLIYRECLNFGENIDRYKIHETYPDYSKKDSFRIGYFDIKWKRRYICKTGRYLKKISPDLSDRAVELISAAIIMSYLLKYLLISKCFVVKTY